MKAKSASLRTKNLAKIISTSKSEFRKNVANKQVHLFLLSKASVRKHAELQLLALSDRLDGRKLGTNVSGRLFSILYSELKRGIEKFNSARSSVQVSKLDISNVSDRKLLAKSGIRPAPDTTIYVLRSTTKNADVFVALNEAVFQRANRKAASFLNTLRLTGAKPIDAGLEVLDIGHLFASSIAFKATVRALIKGAERLPKNKRDEYRGLIIAFATRQVVKVNKSYKNNDWGLEISGHFSITAQRITSVAVIVIAPQSSSINQGTLKYEERAASDALRKYGLDVFDELLLNTTHSPSVMAQAEKFALSAMAKAITKSNQHKNASGRFVTQKELIEGITKVQAMKGRSSVWKGNAGKKIKDQVQELTAIRNIINTYLPEYMQRNMGKGSARTVLNWRTGRLARSARVNKISSNREGAIAASTYYQLNPYATFAPGGERSDPRTRNPKLLVDKSIRQILREKLQLNVSFTSKSEY